MNAAHPSRLIHWSNVSEPLLCLLAIEGGIKIDQINRVGWYVALQNVEIVTVVEMIACHGCFLPIFLLPQIRQVRATILMEQASKVNKSAVMAAA
jgi:hypothetical protein